MRRSPRGVSLQESVSSWVMVFHSRHFSMMESRKDFQTWRQRATAMARFCCASYRRSSSVSFPARYSCAACLVLSSMVGPVLQGIVYTQGNRLHGKAPAAQSECAKGLAAMLQCGYRVTHLISRFTGGLACIAASLPCCALRWYFALRL